MPLASSRVREIVTAVLDGERTGRRAVSVAFLSPGRMRSLHRRAFGTDRLTLMSRISAGESCGRGKNLLTKAWAFLLIRLAGMMLVTDPKACAPAAAG